MVTRPSSCPQQAQLAMLLAKQGTPAPAPAPIIMNNTSVSSSSGGGTTYVVEEEGVDHCRHFCCFVFTGGLWLPIWLCACCCGCCKRPC